jgi:translation initiation factor IF-2
MNDSTKKEPLTMARPNRLELTKTVESGKVKQNFQHGRSKTVTVEVRKTRTFTSNDGGRMVEMKQGGSIQEQADKSLFGKGTSHEEDSHLTDEERQSRLRALESAKTRAAEEPRPAARPVPTPPGSAMIYDKKPLKEIVFEDEANAKAARSENKLNIVKPPAAKPPVTKAPVAVEPEDARSAERKDVNPSKMKLRRGDEARRNSGKITVSQALSMSEERVRSLASLRRQREKARRMEGGAGSGAQEKIVREVIIPEAITVQELANRMAERAVDLVKSLMKMGTMVTVNQSIDADTAELIVSEFGHKVKRVTEGDVENVLRANDEKEDPALLEPRAPVVTIMGHVDHGKTSLLDALRKTDVAAGEAGGITQHIGAYQVTLDTHEKITFLDTPGHEAFTAMRARGAKVTDIVVLVVAADDGIMEQTKEAISHAKAAHVPIIVAVNKIDKPGADTSRVKNELMQYELVPEEFGGEVIVVPVSAKTGEGLDKLQESILLQAEVLELKANPHAKASGAVIEARIDRGRGVVTSLLIQKGTLKVGDIVVAGACYGKVRAIADDKGRSIEEAGPSLPVEIQGLAQAPEAGDEFAVVDNEKTARDITEYRQQRNRSAQSLLGVKSVENLFAASAGTKAKELAVIIKSDVQGSAEAIAQSVQKFSGEEVTVRVLHSGVGAITESDVTLAHATRALIIGFNVRATAQARDMASRDKVNIRYYSIIYEVVEDIKAALSGMLSPTFKENFLGYAEIREMFNLSKWGKVAGCMVTEGNVKRGAKVRLLRDNVVIHTGTLKTLRRFKDDVKEVTSGMECGMAFENYEDMRVGDMIEAYEVEEVARSI